MPGNYNGSFEWLGPRGDETISSSDRNNAGILNLFIEPSDGSSPGRQLAPSPRQQMLHDVSPNGRRVLYFEDGTGFLLFDRNTQESTPYSPPSTVASSSAQFHRGGRFFAFSGATNGTGIWLRAIDQGTPPIQLTRESGRDLQWSPDGKKLYYRSATHMMSLPVEIVGEQVKTGIAEQLFEDPYARAHNTNWAVHPDGRFLFLRHVETREDHQLVYIQKWRAKVESLFAGELSRPTD